MLKRPSSRRKSNPEQVTINLVPMLDALITMISFLLFSMSFLALVSIESPAPIASTEQNEKSLKEKPLQLTLTLHPDEMELWSPFDLIPVQKIANLPDGQPDVLAIHTSLLQIKSKFPTERQIIFVPHSQLNYDSLIAVMDSVRMIEKGDAPIFRKNAETGIDESVTQLFPEIVFGNLLGDN